LIFYLLIFKKSVDHRAEFYQGDLGREEDLEEIISEYQIEAGIHFAANNLVANL
jgi:UDP-glucose 4-epimerase